MVDPVDVVDDRLKKELGAGRASRRSEDREVTENRAISDDDRLEMFRKQLHQSALPDLPMIPGWHLIWLTTTNPRDSIHRRMQLGYEPVRPDEIPGMEYATLKTGEYQGMIGINEMLAFKLPMSLYQAYMQEAHHDAPNREADKLTDTIDMIRQSGQSKGLAFEEGDGMSELRKSAPARGHFIG